MDWLNIGWDKNFNKVPTPPYQMYADLTNMGPPVSNPESILVDTVNQITKSYPGPYYLFASGGADSQCMLWAWKQAKVPFSVISIKYTNGDSNDVMNLHDLETLESFTNEHNIPITYVKFDIINFLENDLEKYAYKYFCTSPQISTYMAMSECVNNGTVIFSGNFGYEIATNTCSVFGLYRYAMESNRSIVPFFLLHDKNIAGCIDDVRIETDIEVPDNCYGNNDMTAKYISNRRKVQKLEAHGFPLHPQETKTTGFERVKDYYQSKQHLVNHKDYIEFANEPSNRVFDILFRYRLSRKVKYKERIVWVK